MSRSFLAALMASSLLASQMSGGESTPHPEGGSTDKGAAIDARAASKRQEAFALRLAKLSSAQRPPSRYIARNVCPFECCQYGTWTARADTDLFDKPDGKVKIATVRKGMEVTATYGEVHLTPDAYGVLFKHEGLKPGEIFFTLDYQGEGSFHIWHSGEISDTDMEGDLTFDSNELYAERGRGCVVASEICWFQRISKLPPAKPVWWIKIKLSDGRVGWTTESKHFDDVDRCG